MFASMHPYPEVVFVLNTVKLLMMHNLKSCARLFFLQVTTSIRLTEMSQQVLFCAIMALITCVSSLPGSVNLRFSRDA